MAIEKVNVLVFGEGGTGKTDSLASLLSPAQLEKTPDIKLRLLATEANSLRGLKEGIRRRGIKLKEGQVQVMVCRPEPKGNVSSFNRASDFEKNFLNLSEKEASAVKVSGDDRKKYKSFHNILVATASFKGVDLVSGEIVDSGDYLKWDSNHVFAVDSLSTCTDHLVDCVKGPRVATIISDYNNVQSNLVSRILLPLTEQAQCSIIMIGHPTLGEDQSVRQPKEEEQKVLMLYPRTFGQALNNRVVSMFSETIYSWVDRDDKFWWAGKKNGVATSPRSFPRKDKLEQDYSKYPIFIPE